MKATNLENTLKGKFERTSVMLMLFLFFIFAIGFMFSGCGSKTVGYNDPEYDPPENMSLSIKVMNNPADNPINTLTISSAKILIKEIEFERVDTSSLEDYEIGPFVVNLGLNGNLKQITAGGIPEGIYEKIEFDIHQADENEPISDPEFIEGPGEHQRYSVIVKGKFNGSNYVYKSIKSVEKELTFLNPITIIKGLRFNVTMTVNPYEWFLSNGNYINPSDPNNSETIDDNIENSFEDIFEDDDKDGEPDN